jgi:hypothetical protein
MGRFVSEHFTTLTLDIKTGVISDEDTPEIWEAAKEVTMEKVRRNKNRVGNAIDKKLLSTINKILIDKLSIRSFCY